MKHLTERELSAIADGALKGEDLWRCERHLEGCDACRDALAALSARDAALDSALAHDPGEEYFATFADRVVGRIASAEQAGEADAPSRGAAAAPGDMLRSPIRLSWWQSPRSLALAGSVTVVVAGAGLVLMTARQAETPLASRELSRATQQAPPASEADSRADAVAAAPRDALPATPLERERGTAAKASAPLSAPVPAPAQLGSDAAARREAASTRMKQVPRGVTGEQRGTAPVSGFAAPPRTTDPNATTAEKLREMKRAALGPAGQKKESDEAPASAQPLDLASEAPAAPAAPAPVLGKVVQRDAGLRAQAGTRPICGTVRDDSGRPLAGVSVTAVDGAGTATSGPDGRFCLELAPGSHQLQLLAVGFRPARLTVTDESAAGGLSATLQPVAVLGTGGLARGGEGGEGATRALRVPAAGNAGSAVTPSALSLGDVPLRTQSDSLRAVAAAAEKLQARAAAGTGPAGYESAALAWERLLPGMDGGSAEIEVRARIAECRFAAWQRSRDTRRAGRAVEALTSYIGRAPAGSRRDLAARWIDQIRSR